MKILNLLVISASVIANFGINSSSAAENFFGCIHYDNQINNQPNNQINTNNQANIAVQPQVQTIHIGYDDVELSDKGIKDFQLKCYKEFFSADHNKFATFDDLKFAPTYLGKLVTSFHIEVRTKRYENNNKFRIKNVFSDVLKEIIERVNKSLKIHNFTEKQVKIIKNRIKKAEKTIRISTNSNAPEITMWNYNKKKKFKKIHKLKNIDNNNSK